MRTRDFLILFVCGVAAVGFLLAAGAQLDYINSQREELKLVINPALENAPPSLAFATVAMGAFRGLIVDILWMRADKLKEEGQFFDARQLAEWITKLQPRFASVWEFHAWNMAYNISVAMPASQPEQRWRWVKNGYELLRDQGIPLNPTSIQLYRELGRIFQHKLGGVSDDAHIYYKLQLAEEIGHLLESPDNGLSRDDIRFFEALIKAPKAWGEINNDPEVAEFVRALQAADGSFTTGDDFIRAYLSLRQNPQRFQPAAFNVIDAYRGTAALGKFDLFAKAHQLRQEWKLDPVMMHEVSQRHGPVDFSDPNKRYPLDWRHPDSHAIYWAVKALDVAIQVDDRDITTHETNTDRIVLHSLQNLFRYGKIMIVEGPVEYPDGEVMMHKDLFLGPDLRVFHAYNNAALAVLEKYADDRGRLESLQNGHRNMLINATFLFYQAGLRREALSIYRQLGQRYPRDDFKVTLEQFARSRFAEELESLGIHDAGEQIVAQLVNAYRLYALRDDDGAAANERLAQEIWDHYFASYGVTERVDLPRMPVLRYFAIGQVLSSDAFPPYVRQGLLARIQVERPELLKQLEQTEGQLRRQIEQLRQTQ